jgi:DNA repair photolyase
VSTQLSLPILQDPPPWRALGARGREQPESAVSGAVARPRTTVVEFVALPVRSVLNTPGSTGMGFWSLNPYVGCEFGCSYCYARDTHRWAVERRAGGQADGRAGAPPDPDPDGDFEHRILVKLDAPDVLARTLQPARLRGKPLVIGTATDPYQPAERKFEVTRGVLEALLGFTGLEIGLITKSPLVTRDIPLLARLAERHDVSVNISLAALDPHLIRRIERRSPGPRARLRALGELTRAGLRAGLMLAPVLPGISDSRAALDALIGAAGEAGAQWVFAAPLRMNDPTRRVFLPLVAREFPALAARYQRAYGGRTNVGREYARALQDRVRALRRKHGIEARSSSRRP